MQQERHQIEILTTVGAVQEDAESVTIGCLVLALGTLDELLSARETEIEGAVLSWALQWMVQVVFRQLVAAQRAFRFSV